MAGVAFEHVGKVYPGGNRAVTDFTLEVADKEFVVLVGPSGCGKTTALRMIAGLESVTEGVVRIGDRIVNHVPSKDRDIAMVFQSYALYPHLKVYDNIAFGLRLRKEPKSEIDARVRQAADTLGLTEFLDRRPGALSGGQRQRVAMGRAIVRRPQVFLMDEPLSNLDAKLRVQMRAEISQMQNDLGVTTLYVTHDQVEAMTMGDRVAVMRKGHLQQVDTPQEVYDRPVNLFVGGFIGSPSMNLVEARIDDGEGGALVLVLGEQRLALDGAALEARSGDPSLHGPDGGARHPARERRGRRRRDRRPGRPPAARHRGAARGAGLGDRRPRPRARIGAGADGGRPRARQGHRRPRGRGARGRRRRADRGPPVGPVPGAGGGAGRAGGRHLVAALLRPRFGAGHL